MDREEKLRRRDNIVLDVTEKLQKGESRGWKQVEHMRVSTEQRQMLLQRRREARHRTESIAKNQPLEIPSVDDPVVVSKVTEFYNHLYGLSMVKCTLHVLIIPCCQ